MKIDASSPKLGLFPTGFETLQSEQSNIFHKLESGLPISNMPVYSNLVHFQDSKHTPIQRWFPYREGFSTKLVNLFINGLEIKGNIFDPFSGSGTTLLAARQANLNSYGIDVNPISVLVSKVENATYDDTTVQKLSKEIDNVRVISKDDNRFTTNFELAERIFNPEILQTLLQLKAYIRVIENERIRNLLYVAWLSIIEEVSNVKKEGNGIKYKNRKRTATGYIEIDKNIWEDQVFPKDRFNFVLARYIRQLNIILTDIKNNYGSSGRRPYIFEGSCLEFNRFFSDEIQFTFFSPPYCNCFDYFEIHKVELWLGDFVKNKEDFRLLRNTGFRSNTNSLNHKPIIYKNKIILELISLLDVSRLWSNRIPNVIEGYFDDMNTLLRELYFQTTKGGYVGIVIGNSAYSNVIIPSDILIADIARDLGFKVENIMVTRHLTTSSQQKQSLAGLKDYLRESVVLLRK